LIAVPAQRQALRNPNVPADNAPEACIAEGVRVFGLRNLADVVKLLNQPDAFQPCVPNTHTEASAGESIANLGLRRRPRTSRGQTGARSRRSRQSQHHYDWSAGVWKDDARQAVSWHPSSLTFEEVLHANPQHGRFASQGREVIPDPLCFDSCIKPMPLWLSERQFKGMSLHRRDDPTLSGQAERPAARPHRSADRSPRRSL
jgi:hypothetical protein